ncbi:MAG: hypothetical protein IPI66_13135 [Chitinophagaceae bacterium]|nr:hypothetical protein [Chitinophagaceae bacterium]MBL0056882.1 hypothetical protein [Chitinophagaceae bacterium]
MTRSSARNLIISMSCLMSFLIPAFAQNNFKLKYQNSQVYAGIEVGSKGIKMSLIEIGRNAQNSGAFNILKDTSVNTDFISFTKPTFDATLNGFSKLYQVALTDYKIPGEKIYTVISSGVKGQAEKDDKMNWITQLIDAFKRNINEPARSVPVIDVVEEARLSHLGIIPDSRRYTTFLIDIGSGNTKGGYFPNGNTRDLKLFQLNWGTKSTHNATDKRCDNDKSLANYSKQLGRVLLSAENAEIIYAVNASGSYNMSDNIAFSGGIAWSIATLAFPELIENSVVPVTYEDVVKFAERLERNPLSYSDSAIASAMSASGGNAALASKEAKRVNQVFDQRSLMAGTGLLLKIMRQFEGVWEKKQFFLVKNGQVGWISAYVDNHISK